MAAKADKPRVTAADLRRMLRTRCAPPEWAIFFEVHNGTGGVHRRSADAVAMTLWPSRGLEVHGFEIKVSRRDWLNEKKRPEKADAIGRFCDRWWLVVSDDAVVDTMNELPKAWGLLVARGGKLLTVVDAPALHPEPLDRSFVAALLRRAHEELAEMIPKSDINTKLNERWSEGYDAGQRAAAHAASFDYRAIVENFEKGAGVKLSEYSAERTGESFAEYLANKEVVGRSRGRLKVIAKMAEDVADEAKRQIAEIEKENCE